MEKQIKKLVKPVNELDKKLLNKYEALEECSCRSDEDSACRQRRFFADEDVEDILF